MERQELQQRIKLYVSNRGNPEHWLQNGVCKRIDLQKALGNHLSWKERYIFSLGYIHVVIKSYLITFAAKCIQYL